MWAHHRWSHAVAAVATYVLVSCATPALTKKNKTVHIVFSNHLVSCTSASTRSILPRDITLCRWAQQEVLMLQDIGFDGISPLIGSDDNVVNVYWGSYFPKAVSPPGSTPFRVNCSSSEDAPTAP